MNASANGLLKHDVSRGKERPLNRQANRPAAGKQTRCSRQVNQ